MLKKCIKVPGKVHLMHTFNLLVTIESEDFIFLNFKQ